MVHKPVAPRIALNKSYLKVKPNRSDIEKFKNHVIELLDQINEKESEEFHKNIISKFLDKTYYSGNHYINTKGRNDLVIHFANDAKSNVGVIIETKKPTNKSEMVHKDNLNTKAFQELILYYMRERVTGNNLKVTHLIVTNIYEWFIFGVDIFEKAFAQNKEFENKFIDFEEKRLAGKNTEFFYKEIAEPAVADLLSGNTKVGKEFVYTHFDIREYEKIVRNSNKEDDNKLIALFKFLSPEHLLTLPFKNDSNSLDKTFYAELLHIIGLTEIKDSGKKLIDRKAHNDRDEGSLLENTINQLESLDKLSRLDKPTQFGTTIKERYFNVGLELSITWVNRILFLKLLEAQLVRYHKNDKAYSFLNKGKIKDFDDLNGLFFQVLAKESKDRGTAMKEVFNNVPYLNSSLFEPSDLEQVCFPISQLQDSKLLPILPNTVLKDNNGKRRSGNLNALDYLLSFLDAYDFSSEGSEQIQEENKTLINASVLGLIFEKINGYKDGSFFTPGFITMYMCRETIRKAVVQKFNEIKGWNCKLFDDLYDKIDDKKEANDIVNSLKIVDPAVGSGHFLVSTLNEIIAVKSNLKILLDRNGKTLRDYDAEVANDELAITDEDGKLFDYNPKNKESQRVQETLFHEKQTLIENCLFGVDINTNSVKICRLRLWVELLKHAYYKSDSNYTQLETLPNIDINIKCGNSLISRFPLDSDLSQTLKKSKITIKSYQQAVQSYRHATSKDNKREMEQLISSIKTNFRTEISNNDSKVKRLSARRGDLNRLVNQHSLFEISKVEQKEQKKLQVKLRSEVEKLESEIEEIRSNKIYENAFEWRFEFPEVLDNDGNFIGFDLAIGNPPYGVIADAVLKNFFKQYYKNLEGRFDLFEAFIENSMRMINKTGFLYFIIPNTLLTNLYSKKLRTELKNKHSIVELTNFGMDVFEDPTVHTCIIGLKKEQSILQTRIRRQIWQREDLLNEIDDLVETIKLGSNTNVTFDISLDEADTGIFNKLSSLEKLGDICFIRQCIKTGNDPEYVIKSDIPLSDPWKKAMRGKGIGRYSTVEDNLYVKYGDWLARNWKNKSFYETPKIAVRETGSRIISTIDLEHRYLLSSLYSVYPKGKFDLDLLEKMLGIMNSKFATYYIHKVAFEFTAGAFTKVRTNQLARLPIPNLSNKRGLLLRDKVSQVLTMKRKDLTSDISQLELEIDSIVYELYNLTEDEIAFIEKGV